MAHLQPEPQAATADIPVATAADVPVAKAPADAAARRGTSRRWFLGGGFAVLLAGAGGAGAALLRPEKIADKPEPAPRALLEAVASERALIADLDATTGGSFAVRQVIRQARADHAAHLRALESAASSYGPTPSSTPSRTVPRGEARTAVELGSAERTAATLAARRAAALDGHPAILLASISACEATHAELFA